MHKCMKQKSSIMSKSLKNPYQLVKIKNTLVIFNFTRELYKICLDIGLFKIFPVPHTKFAYDSVRASIIFYYNYSDL